MTVASCQKGSFTLTVNARWGWGCIGSLAWLNLTRFWVQQVWPYLCQAKHKASQTASISRGAAVANLGWQEVQQFLLKSHPSLTIKTDLLLATKCARGRSYLISEDRLCSRGASWDTSTTWARPGTACGRTCGRGGSSPGAATSDERCHYLCTYLGLHLS